MAEESKVVGSDGVSVETTDRGLFGSKGKKEEKPQEEMIVVEPEKKILSGEEKPEKNDTFTPAEKYEDAVSGPPAPKEKNGILEKIEEKLPGQQKKPEEVPPPQVPVVESVVEGEPKAEKKGIMEKIKEKLPGHHPKTTEEELEKK